MSCGTQSALSGVWQQVDFSPEQGLLYEFHLGQYGEQLTGLVVRYRSPLREELGAYEKFDRCDCFFIRQGRVRESRISFRLFNSNVTRSVNGGARCAPAEGECARVFEFREEPSGELSGESWCEGRREESLPLTLSAVDSVSIERCWLPEEEERVIDQGPPPAPQRDDRSSAALGDAASDVTDAQ